MNEPQDNLIAYLSALQESVRHAVGRLPLKSRFAQGLLMAARAVGGAGLAYGIGRALHTEQAFWAAITAIAVVQPNYTDMVAQSRDQVIGAAAGGVCGFAAATLGPADAGVYLAAVAVVMVACWLLKVGSAARLGGITTTIVLLVPAQGPAWDIAQVLIGMACALPVGWLVSYAERRWLIAAGTLPSDSK
jgi:uncharacterized membrane protein YccC